MNVSPLTQERMEQIEALSRESFGGIRRVNSRIIRLVDGGFSVEMSIGKNNEMFVVFDSADFESVSRYSWHPFRWKGGYYARSKRVMPAIKSAFFMHRMLLGFPDASVDIDHRDGNGLNNRRLNIRSATRSQNQQNAYRGSSTSGFKGVYWTSKKRGFVAKIQSPNGPETLGFSQNAEECARLYDAAARRYFGEFARLNFQQ